MQLRALVLLCLLSAGPAVAGGVGEPAPGFEASLLAGGEPIKLAGFRGKVVYLDFWASWCAPCGASLPWMEKMRKEFGPQGFEVLAVNVDEEPEDGLRFLKRFKLSYPVLGDRKGRIAELYDVKEMPSSYLIDREGVLRKVHRGFNSEMAVTLRREIARLVGEGA